MLDLKNVKLFKFLSHLLLSRKYPTIPNKLPITKQGNLVYVYTKKIPLTPPLKSTFQTLPVEALVIGNISQVLNTHDMHK